MPSSWSSCTGAMRRWTDRQAVPVRTIGKTIFATSIIQHWLVRRSQGQTYFLFSNGRNTSTPRTAVRRLEVTACPVVTIVGQITRAWFRPHSTSFVSDQRSQVCRSRIEHKRMILLLLCLLWRCVVHWWSQRVSATPYDSLISVLVIPLFYLLYPLFSFTNQPSNTLPHSPSHSICEFTNLVT
jgi:hypothetical protein